MIKKTISYTDYDGNERKEDFYFNLNRAELIELEISVEGGLSAWAQSIVDSRDYKTMMDTFKKIIGKAYGTKSPDGRRFIKSDEITNEFFQTDAFSELLTEFLTDTDSMTAFFNGLVSGIDEKNRQNIVPLQQN